MNDLAVVEQRVARLPFQAGGGGSSPTPRLHFTTVGVDETAFLLRSSHYLGPIRSGRYAFAGWVDDGLVAAMVYRWPTARYLPNDETWLELVRWCLTPEAGKNAGSRMMRWVRSWLMREARGVTTLVSYSDPSAGHTGALYRASGWVWAPTWHRLRPPPSGNGSWGHGNESVKDRWVYELGPDARRAQVLAVKDAAAVRAFESRENR